MTAIPGQLQFYKNFVVVNGVTLPALPGVSLSLPENYSIPPILGSYWQLTVGQGFINPSVDVSFVIRDVAGEVMSQGFWDMFHARTNDYSHDTTDIGDLVIWMADGTSGFILKNSKADSYSLSVSKGASISLNCHFVGSHVVPATVAPTFAGWSRANELRFNSIAFASPLDSQVFEAGLTYSNNHTPNMALDGTEFPAAQNAGMMTASMNISTQITTANRPDNGTFPSPSVLTPIQFQIVGSTKTATFLMPNPINNTKRSRQINTGRVMQGSNYILLGGNGITSPPVQVSVA